MKTCQSHILATMSYICRSKPEGSEGLSERDSLAGTFCRVDLSLESLQFRLENTSGGCWGCLRGINSATVTLQHPHWPAHGALPLHNPTGVDFADPYFGGITAPVDFHRSALGTWFASLWRERSYMQMLWHHWWDCKFQEILKPVQQSSAWTKLKMAHLWKFESILTVGACNCLQIQNNETIKYWIDGYRDQSGASS